ncbi:MAG: ribonuclease HII [Clostridiales Family XIII bacterium]|jgi:ribonuclease HII|nr:ribonuclease HII [Clostridiales Family XIII bacterium]
MNKKEREAALAEKLARMKTYEQGLYAQGLSFVAGVDEVGRGPLAGPVCAACVVLPPDFAVLGVDDSKKLTEKRREALYDEIISVALAWGVGTVGNRRIDDINILAATKEAMLIAIEETNRMLAGIAFGRELPRRERKDAPRIEHILIDAVPLPEAGTPFTAIIKGDESSVSIAAASILAKVTRDRIMVQFDSIYPGYALASNKGYGTAAHYEGLKAFGLTPIHRRTFLKEWF